MCLDHGGSIYCQLTDNITLFTHKHLFTWCPFMILASLVFDMDFTVNLVHECGSLVSNSYSTFCHSWWKARHGSGSKATQLSSSWWKARHGSGSKAIFDLWSQACLEMKTRSYPLLLNKTDIPYRQNHCLGCLLWGLLRFALVSCPDGVRLSF